MKPFFDWIESLSPFVQGILGSLVVVFLLFIIRIFFKLIIVSNKQTDYYNQIDLVTKYWIHKNYLNSNNFLLCQGYLFIIKKSLEWTFLGILIFCFFEAVSALIAMNFVTLIFYFVLFNCFFEARSWLRDKSDGKKVNKLDPKVREFILKQLGVPDEKFIDPTKKREQIYEKLKQYLKS